MEQNHATAQGYANSLFFIAPTPQIWEQMRPTILDLYLRQGKELSETVVIMRVQHMFHAVEHDYKHYFSVWNITKNIPTQVKNAAIVALGKRTWGRYSTPDVGYKKDDGQIISIEKKRIKRQIKTIESKKAKEETQVQLSNNVFMHWNLPYRAARYSSGQQHASPFGPTPDFVHFASPGDHRLLLRNRISPNGASTPTMVAVRGMKLEERASLFIGAKHSDLLNQMEGPERKILTTYLYQFWLFSFTTAKYWGFGPVDWAAENFAFDRFKDVDRYGSSPNTPGASIRTPGSFLTPRVEDHQFNGNSPLYSPSPLCRWTIHGATGVEFKMYGIELHDCTDSDTIADPDGDVNLSRWPTDHKQDFAEKLQRALESSRFSDVDSKDLPVSMAKIARVTRSSLAELQNESFAFSIMARNEEVFYALLEKVRHSFESTGVYPLHLLTSFLDGSKTCCNLLDSAMQALAEAGRVNKIYVNNHGHTVLDNLFIAILKGHTSCQPSTVDDKLSNLKRFVGDEVDICGRWDADSPCVRRLFAEGSPAIPIEWKHAFCHTSAQTICHSIGRLFGPVFAPKINTLSGLFLKTCQACGMQLQLMPLHALVLTACHLAESGCAGETLFGMLACLVCLLANGADPLLTAHISLAALLRKDNAIECSHEDIDPTELTERVPASLISGWTKDAILGWNVFCTTLRLARDQRRSSARDTSTATTRVGHGVGHNYSRDRDFSSDLEDDQSDVDDDDDDDTCSHEKPKTGNFYGQSVVIGELWAAIQTELVTYRRLSDGDPWLSENFDLSCLLDGLINGGMVSIKLVEEDMMELFCKCGRFFDVDDEACACVEEVCTHYFANLDVWNRASFIPIPESKNISWYGW